MFNHIVRGIQFSETVKTPLTRALQDRLPIFRHGEEVHILHTRHRGWCRSLDKAVDFRWEFDSDPRTFLLSSQNVQAPFRLKRLKLLVARAFGHRSSIL